MSGEMIQFQGNGHERQGYLATATGEAPGVIVLQEWWGLVGHIKAVTDRFASAGFHALAPDLYEGKSADEPDEAASLFMALNIEQTEKILRGAISALLATPRVKGEKVGVVGFCMGGQLSMFAACVDPRIGACVNFYGVHPNVHPAFANLHAPMLGHFAETDDYASPQRVAELSEELTNLGKPHEFITYPGTRHAFFNDERPAYDPDASKDAWDRMISFFQNHLT